MDVKKYLEMNVEELDRNVIADVMAHLPEVSLMVEEARKTERYREDEVFRAFIDSAETLAEFSMGDGSRLYERSGELVGRTRHLSLWNLHSLHWNMLGNFYRMLNLCEKAMECYYHVIRNEREHGFKGFLSIAYNNIALVYMANISDSEVDSDACEKCCANFELGISSLKEGGEDQPRYVPKLLTLMNSLAWLLIGMKKFDEVKELLEEMKTLDFSKATVEVLCSHYQVLMYYYVEIGDCDRAYECYLETQKYVAQGDSDSHLILEIEYVRRCRIAGIDPLYYEKEVLEIENLDGKNREQINMMIIEELYQYYKLTGNSEKLSVLRESYIAAKEKDFVNVRSGRLQGLNMVDELLKQKDAMAEESSKNLELTKVAEEAVRSKNESQRAYRQIDLVHQLGQKLTSSMNLELVVELIYENLKENLPLDSFILMVSDEKKRQLRSVAYYEDERKLPGFSLVWDDPKSLFARCFRTKGSIVIKDFSKDPRFSYREILWIGTDTVRSGVFLPLTVEGEVIGVFSVQARKLAAYGKSDLEFLNLLTPFLSIALNNGIYSSRLEREIHDRIQAQQELEGANRKLEQLSSLDGLTQISNRREFECRLLELLHEATERERTVGIFMFDIDNFKKYNDTYGHLQGDEALKSVAAVVQEHLTAAGGISARFGGEEFIGACTGLSSSECAALGDGICAGVRALGMEHSAVPLGILTLSIGVAVGEGAVLSDKSLLMRSADDALYEAKNRGKNRTVVHLDFEESEERGNDISE